MYTWEEIKDEFYTHKDYKICDGNTLRILQDDDIIDVFNKHYTATPTHCSLFLYRLKRCTNEELNLLYQEIDRGTISKWLNGVHMPGPKNIEKVKRILGIHEEVLSEPDAETKLEVAAVETLKFIQSCRTPAEEPLIKMDINVYKVLSILQRDLKLFEQPITNSMETQKYLHLFGDLLSTIIASTGFSAIDSVDCLEMIRLTWEVSMILLDDAIYEDLIKVVTIPKEA